MLKASRGTIGMLAQQAKDGECIVQRCRCCHLWAAELVTAAIEESDALRCRKAIASLDRAQDASIRRARRETGRHLPSSRPSGGVRGGCLTGSLCGLIAICGIRGSCGVTFLGRSASLLRYPRYPFRDLVRRCSAPTDSRTFQSTSHARIEASIRRVALSSTWPSTAAAPCAPVSNAVARLRPFSAALPKCLAMTTMRRKGGPPQGCNC